MQTDSIIQSPQDSAQLNYKSAAQKSEHLINYSAGFMMILLIRRLL